MPLKFLISIGSNCCGTAAARGKIVRVALALNPMIPIGSNCCGTAAARGKVVRVALALNPMMPIGANVCVNSAMISESSYLKGKCRHKNRLTSSNRKFIHDHITAVAG